MEQHGRVLANSHLVGLQRAPDQLLKRLDHNETILLEVHKLLMAAVQSGSRISPAGEWILDNFYLIEDQIRTAKRHLPKRYSRQLPRLVQGPSAGLPRVYDIALEAISHGDGRVDLESLNRFVAAYQEVTALNLGELWAVPIMLRLALIENLRRIGTRLVVSTVHKDLADAWADQMMETTERDPKSLILLVADMARSNPPMAGSFVAELVRRLQGQSSALALPLTWIEQHLAESGRTIEQLVQSETQEQASGQVSISNSIGSLRFLGAMDWREFVENISGVERILREDPAQFYSRMDFTTRDRYRHAVEKIAKTSPMTECDVARKAIQLAQESAAAAVTVEESSVAGIERRFHVGYYLVDKGLPHLCRIAGTQSSLGETLRRAASTTPLVPYLGSIALLTMIFTAALWAAEPLGWPWNWMLAPVLILVALCTSHLAVALVNWAVSLLAVPQPLARLDFSAEIPPDCRTLVVIPTMINSAQTIEDLVEALEVRFLANRDANLHFGLLTDFGDAAQATLPEDEPLLALATARIEELNQKYPDANNAPGGVFFLFHRPRRWNPGELLWMGYERKRGKLSELNSLLRGDGRDYFSAVVGAANLLSGIKYVITLDTDTQLPRDAARQFAGAMAHPLNRAYFDNMRHKVTEGYGIMQPRVATSLSGANRSRYTRLFEGEPGIDPYTRAVSDVYQDLFGEASFIGKGIYDVDTFELSLKGRFPENRILSHDLLEGSYARTALLSDVLLYEAYPGRYEDDVKRRHRWIRGDWQIASWLLSRVPRSSTGGNGLRRQDMPSVLNQWKIFDNLRRSLVPSGLVLLLLWGWIASPAPAVWALAVVAIVLAQPVIASILDFLRKPEDTSPAQHLDSASRSLGRVIAQALVSFACLPHEAYYSLDAILRTHWRLLVTKTNLLEWVSSDRPPNSANRRSGPTAAYRSMWAGPALSIVVAGYLNFRAPVAFALAIPILTLWLAAPALMWWLSQPIVRREASLAESQIIFLRKIARKTWAFFESFAGEEDHWLPPDNFQEHPIAVVAHRTSPSNMGLSLLANFSAYDFGYIGITTLVERTANAFSTMEAMPRHLGHFYNWYDTRTLQPLAPRYVSSVDSGNLAGHLLTLRQGLLALPDQSIFGPRLFEGLLDTLNVLLDKVAPPSPAAAVQMEQLRQSVESAREATPGTLGAVQIRLEQLEKSIAKLADSFGTGMNPGQADAARGDVPWWVSALHRQCRGAMAELAVFAPWLSMPEVSRGLRRALELAGIPTLRELANDGAQWLAEIEQQRNAEPTAGEQEFLNECRRRIGEASHHAKRQVAEIERLALQSGQFADMDFGFLYDRARHLMAIGYNVDERRLDSSFYDLLASEARLCNFVAIAQGQIPQESWFTLGRQCIGSAGDLTLMSWSGSMFEYLMPLLVMPTYENTLLDETCHAAVRRQIAYGEQRGVAWGISESGYSALDVDRNYQYRAFGVPGLGLKRGLGDDLVVAPYASALALMVAPTQACENLQRLEREGLMGEFGFYEAVDYTPSRLQRGHTSAVIRSFMAHHQGMVFLSLAYLLLDRPMQKRFEAEPMFQATSLLLQERVPKSGAQRARSIESSTLPLPDDGEQTPVRTTDTPDTALPEVQLLSNGRYHVMVTNSGGGYSRWNDIAITRWREDPTRDNWGAFCYLRDVDSGVFWSNTHQPTLKRADTYEAIFSEGRAEFRRRDLDYETYTEIVVSPEDDIELRRMRITNRAKVRRTIEITSYAEIVIAPPATDDLHAAFSNLFVQTEIVRERQAVLCTRRPRSLGDPSPWMFHLIVTRGAKAGPVSYETDRLKFIGRGRTVTAPQAMLNPAALSGSVGSVLDPIAAVRQQVTLDPEQTVTIDMVSGIDSTREGALSLAGKYQDRHLADRVLDLAWTHSQVVLRQINATTADSQLYARLAGSVIFSNAGLRPDASVLSSNSRGQSGLWGYAISGDLPIVLLQIGDGDHFDLVRQLVQAHAYWRLKGLTVDLVIWNEDRGGYRQLLQEQIMGLIAGAVDAHVMDKPGGIYVRRADQIAHEDRILVQSVARAIISDRRGTLGDQIGRQGPTGRSSHLYPPKLRPTRPHRADPPRIIPIAANELLFHNGLGGFTSDGREYVITTTHGQSTPAPWINVLANPNFGTIVSESGAAYTWSENAHEFRLTPWDNDPVSDTSGEAFYIRDEETGHFWSPAPFPARGATSYTSRHGFGYSTFSHVEGEISSELVVYVALNDPVKFSVLKVRNESGRARKISVTGYVEWVLGDLRSKSGMHVITEIDAGGGAILARNAYNTEFTGRTAFFDVDATTRFFSGDRTEFLGRNGTPRNPAVMGRTQLSNRVGVAMDPCAAFQVPLELADGEERTLTFRLGAGRNIDETRELLLRNRGRAAARDALEKTQRHWVHVLGAVQVETPDQSLNVLANGWLAYQTLACRLWARSGFYQSGGAFGFRDQLQDVMALIHAQPGLVREHLLLCAAHQFREGDVQHWWHPPSDRGVRTQCSDDFLWLPLAVARYVFTTGDSSVLDEPAGFLDGRLVNPDEDSYYDLPGRSRESATLYQHCVKAVLRGLRFGEHGLPLMGTGDWNDGMNLVGAHGKGESVWLGFFLYDVLMQFGKIARATGDSSFAERCEQEADQLRRNISSHGWDGKWYRRAYFDDGTPLGSSSNAECQIDSISQSWSVLSGAGDPARSLAAMEEVNRRLVVRDHALIQLLDPPFDKSALDPGYIKGYVPGVRENGGQYTHAAIWTVMGFAALGDNKRAWELFDMINPVHHASSAESVAIYKVEPYVMAADVYAVAPHVGRGGWTWYTGSAGWMYRLILESLLGLIRESDTLRFAPCLPAHWDSFKLHYRFKETTYHIRILQALNDDGPMVVMQDGVLLSQGIVALIDDHGEHEIEVKLCRPNTAN